MSRYSSSGAYDFNIRKFNLFGEEEYEISWVVDFYYSSSRIRFPRTFSRITDLKGAEIFRKKHGLKEI